jgi:transcription termination factor Rho
MMDEQSGQRYAGLYATNDVSKTPTALIKPQSPNEQIYTCYPDHDMHLEQNPTHTHEIIVPFGIYEIHIIRGEKYIRLRQ